MIKRIEGHDVDVSQKNCGPDLPCYHLFFDKGTYTRGRGYTSYHAKERVVCGTRHLRGCPKAGICLDCRLIYSPAAVAESVCSGCGSKNLQPVQESDAPESKD